MNHILPPYQSMSFYSLNSSMQFCSPDLKAVFCLVIIHSAWQLVKNAFLKNERTLTRKILEMALALALERTLSKRQILSSYMNQVKHIPFFLF